MDRTERGNNCFRLHPPRRGLHFSDVESLKILWTWHANGDVDGDGYDDVTDQQTQECVMDNHPSAGGQTCETAVEKNNRYLNRGDDELEEDLSHPHQLRRPISWKGVSTKQKCWHTDM